MEARILDPKLIYRATSIESISSFEESNKIKTKETVHLFRLANWIVLVIFFFFYSKKIDIRYA